MNHACPVCGEILPKEAYHGDYFGCIQLMDLDEDGICCTGWGTLRLSDSRDGFMAYKEGLKEKMLVVFQRFRDAESKGPRFKLGHYHTGDTA